MAEYAGDREKKDKPDSTSSDHDAQAPFWRTVSAILGGAVEMRKPILGVVSVAGPQQPYAQIRTLKTRLGVTVAQSPFLPAFESETAECYSRRRENASLVNIYGDASANLASKPFTKQCQLEDDAADDLKKLALDIDGQGNSLHVFAQRAFKRGIDYAIHWILVDYPKVPVTATLADERAIGGRPYWVHIPAEKVLAVYSVFLGSKEQFYHVRIDECVVEQEGYGEVVKKRVRIFKRERVQDGLGRVVALGPPYFEVWEEQGTESDRVWNLVDGGSLYGMSQIPIVPFITGEREGTTWKICPPLRDLALLQVEEFQQESGLKHIKELTAFPMLAGNGVKPKKADDGTDVVVPVGPASVLFAPPDGNGEHGEWVWIAPPAECLVFLQSDLEKLQQSMRNLGKQPLAEANLTVVTTANVSMKASSQVQAWALLFKDALEVAWSLTCEWLRVKPAPKVKVHTDFAVELEQGKEGDHILKLNEQGVLSKEDTAIEFKRRGTLRDDFDWEENQERIAAETESLEPEEPIDPITGKPVPVRQGQPAPRTVN